MSEFSPEETEKRKRAIFDQMSPRRQRHILKRGWDKWDPFMDPKDPIDIRRDTTRRTTQQLFKEFLKSRSEQGYSSAYGQGVLEICLGLVNDDERYRAMFEFSCWYRDLLDKEASREP
ncbi:MAG: hypothetical protein PVG78_02015 [Desulfobacterales bacterium]|jgi:hypothetical protein